MQRQKILVLYTANSALDSPVIGWSVYDGTGQTRPMAGDQDEPPYRTGVDALKDGWRLIQAAQLLPHGRGEEFDLLIKKSTKQFLNLAVRSCLPVYLFAVNDLA